MTWLIIAVVGALVAIRVIVAGVMVAALFDAARPSVASVACGLLGVVSVGLLGAAVGIAVALAAVDARFGW
jgi:hypothetical protein